MHKYSCYETLTSYINNEIVGKLKRQWIVSVEEYLKCHAKITEFYYMHFLLRDIAFDFYNTNPYERPQDF